MAKKYIIEKDDNESIWSIYADANGDATIEGVSLTPYTEPDMEQVRKEAYQQGLSDAWDAARKIVLPGDVSGIYLADLEEIFDRSSLQDVIKDYSASECIEKIRQYEQEKEEQIQVGDEVRNIHHGWTAVVSAIDRECMTLMDTNGELGDGYDVNRFTKTGRHFPEIAEVLQKMKES